MNMRGLAVVLALAIAAAPPSPAHAEPSDGALVGVGLALAPPTYVLGVATHEGTHALAAKLMGAEVTRITLWPGRDPRTGAFHFGQTGIRGLRGDGKLAAFLVAPKVVDLALLGGFAALLYAGGGPDDGAAWPANRYGQLALTVLATGWWVDFAKDVLSFSRHNDAVRVMTLAGLTTELRRLPARLAYLAADVGLGLLVWQGYRRVFAEPASSDAAFTLPLARAAF